MSLIVGALVAGAVGSPHCVGMCGGFASACRDGQASYHVGRLITYGTLGGLAGGLGAAIPWSPVVSVVSGVLVVWFALSMGGWVQAPKIRVPGITEGAAWAMRQGGGVGHLALGMATALLPCGLVYGAVGLALAAGNVVDGALVMLAFGAGTVPLLAAFALGLQRWTAQHVWRRQALALLVLVAGLSSVGMRHATAMETPADEAPACH
jgi:sulfite exporter TauE/SafE